MENAEVNSFFVLSQLYNTLNYENNDEQPEILDRCIKELIGNVYNPISSNVYLQSKDDDNSNVFLKRKR